MKRSRAPKCRGSRRPGQSSHRLALSVNQIFQMLADRPGITQVMVCLHEAAEEFSGRRAPHLVDLQRTQLSQRTLQRCAHPLRWARGGSVLRGIVGWAKPLSRQSDVTRSVQLQHQAPGDHVARTAIGLSPVPGRTQLGREPPPTQTGMGGDQLADKLNSWALTLRPR